MKNYLKIYIYALFIPLALLNACDDPDDLVTKNAKEGALLSYSTDGAFLGNPNPTTSSIDFVETSGKVMVDVAETSGPINSLKLYKSLNGGAKISVGETTTWPYTYQIPDLNTLTSGFNNQSLNIGDRVAYSAEINMADGRVLLNNSSASFVIACKSDLAGTYTVVGSGRGRNYTGDVVIEETSIGVYKISSFGYWGPNLGTPYGGVISDVCSQITINTTLGAFSNTVVGAGTVEGTVLKLKYVIPLGGTDVEFNDVLTKK